MIIIVSSETLVLHTGGRRAAAPSGVRRWRRGRWRRRRRFDCRCNVQGERRRGGAEVCGHMGDAVRKGCGARISTLRPWRTRRSSARPLRTAAFPSELVRKYDALDDVILLLVFSKAAGGVCTAARSEPSTAPRSPDAKVGEPGEGAVDPPAGRPAKI